MLSPDRRRHAWLMKLCFVMRKNQWHSDSDARVRSYETPKCKSLKSFLQNVERSFRSCVQSMREGRPTPNTNFVLKPTVPYEITIDRISSSLDSQNPLLDFSNPGKHDFVHPSTPASSLLDSWPLLQAT
jgi:hypothetical protein